MIKFLHDHKGRPMIGFGLSRGNCDKLLAGKPIFVDLKVMMASVKVDLNEATVVIFGGEDEAAMIAELEKHVNLPAPKTHREEN